MNKPQPRTAYEMDCASRKARRVLGSKPGRWTFCKRAMNRRHRKAGKTPEME